MSTFYATFDDADAARRVLDRLLGGRLRPDDVSLVAPMNGGAGEHGEIREETGSVGDATAFVGRPDDPDEEFPTSHRRHATGLTSVGQAEGVYGIDTSDRDTNVETVDQSADSQEHAENNSEPREIMQSEHERDDLGLTVKTGFPTPVPVADEVLDTVTEEDRQAHETLEAIEVTGVGRVFGRGALATAALDFVDPEGSHDVTPVERFLLDEGVPKQMAERYSHALKRGHSLVAVELGPGQAEFVERTAGEGGAHNAGTFAAPRYYDHERAETPPGEPTERGV
jgi:hypothetical protein